MPLFLWRPPLLPFRLGEEAVDEPLPSYLPCLI